MAKGNPLFLLKPEERYTVAEFLKKITMYNASELERLIGKVNQDLICDFQGNHIDTSGVAMFVRIDVWQQKQKIIYIYAD